jgi:transcriptional regulator with XRE-family HTH domain
VQSFARELRLHCARKGTIAQLCKSTGINRQQFNKYLAGQILPNARTMRKICAYLGVSEAQLMGESQAGAPERTAVQGEVGSVPAPSLSHARLKNGFYSGYFPVHGRPNLVARWLVHVRGESGGVQSHSCRNRFRGASALGYSAYHLRYGGPVRYGAEEACLIGMTRAPLPLHGVVFVNLRPVAGEDFFSAMVLTRRDEGPLALSGAMQFMGTGCTARKALSVMGIISLDDPTIDSEILRIMRAAPAAGPNWIQSVNERNLPADEPTEGF